MLLSNFFETQYRPLKLIRGSDRTVTLYRYSINAYSLHIGRDASINDLNDLDVSRHLMTLLANGKSPHTAEKERCQLLAIWRFAVLRGLLQVGPTVQAIPTPEDNPKAWTRAELKKLFRACKTTPGEICGLPARYWWLALHQVLWDSAERIGAVRKSKWSDLRGEWITFPAENRKGGRRPNQRKLHPDTIASLALIKRNPNDLIFPWDRTESTLYHHYGRLLQRAGLDDSKQSKFHRMRRSAGTHVSAAGGDAQQVLQHQNAKTTERYLDRTIASEPQPVDWLFRAG